MKKVIILILTLFLSFFFIEKNTPVKAEGVPMLDKTGEMSKIQVVDSVGRFEKISNKKYKYTYVKLSYNEEFEYYYHPNATTESIELSLDEMPKIAFDSNENLINGYFSINNNYWYKCKVEDKTDVIDFNWAYQRMLSSDYIENDLPAYCYFEIYFNFNFDFNVIYELSFNLPIFYDSRFGMKDKYVSTFECHLKNDDYIDNIYGSIVDKFSWVINGFKDPTITISVIEIGDFVLPDGLHYSCKTIFVDNEYYVFDSNKGLFENSVFIKKWTDVSVRNKPTCFNLKYFPSNRDADGKKYPLNADCVYSYKGVLYSFEDLDGTLNLQPGQELPDLNNVPNCNNVLNCGEVSKILKIIIIIIVILFLLFLIKLISKKEKTNSSRDGNYSKK